MTNTENAAIMTVPAADMAKLYSSLHAETRAEKVALYNAVSNSASLEDAIGQTLAVTDVIMQPVTTYDEATGEERRATRTVFVCEDGTAYGCTSSGVETSLRNIFAIVGAPTWQPALMIKPVKIKGNRGYKFTSLELV